MDEPDAPPVVTTPAASAVAQGEARRPAPRAVASAVESICDLDPAIEYAARIRPHRRKEGEPLFRPLRIYTRDPAGERAAGNEVEVRVPYEPLDPGPVGSTLAVDNDWPGGIEFRPADLDDHALLLSHGLSPSATDPRFHAQMVYAVARLTYATFQTALGRDPAWAFPPADDDRQILTLRPFGALEANAAYRRDRREIAFGCFEIKGAPRGRAFPGGYVFTSLSHDVIVHEMTHALLDGMRARFLLPTRPDVLAFHEGFADLVAIFQRFTYKELVREALRRTGGSLAGADVLFEVARELGQTTGHTGALRSPIQSAGELTTYHSAGDEPHALGSVFVSAVFDAYQTLYERKTARLLRVATGHSRPSTGFEPNGDLLDLLATEASKLAAQFLNLLIRAVDYCPPVDLSLGEFLRAVITADRELVPDDPWSYREAWIDAFARRHIVPRSVPTLTEDALLWRPAKGTEAITDLSFARLRFAGDPARPAGADELRRQADVLGRFVSAPERLPTFGLAPLGAGSERPVIHSIRTTRRIGPDGQVLFDLVAEITQRHLRTSTIGTVPLFTGSTVVIGPEGEVRFVIRKGAPRAEPTAEQRLALEQQLAFVANPHAQWRREGNVWCEPDCGVLARLHAD